MGAIAGFASVLIFDQRVTPRAPVPGLSLILAPVATGAVMRWLGTLWTRRRGDPPTLFTFLVAPSSHWAWRSSDWSCFEQRA